MYYYHTSRSKVLEFIRISECLAGAAGNFFFGKDCFNCRTQRITSVSGSCSLKPPMNDKKMDELKIFVGQSLSSTLETVKTKQKII
jgi:hypothetical protein